MAMQSKIVTGREFVPLRFTEEELRFLMENRIARLATASRRGDPHVVPIAFEFDGHYIYFSGLDLARSLKFRQIQENSHVALVVDMETSLALWDSRGIEIRGIADIHQCEGRPYVRITPVKSVSWGL